MSNCLVIGLCLGTIPNALYNKNINRIDCVEINPLLCNIYKKFFRISKKIHIYQESGVTFVNRTNKLYDAIFIDIPCKFITKSFMHDISRISIGKVYINLIGKECNKMNLFGDFKVLYYKVIDENFLYILTNN